MRTAHTPRAGATWRSDAEARIRDRDSSCGRSLTGSVHRPVKKRVVAPKLTFQPTCVDTSSDDQDGYLVLADDCLVAVLVRLDGEEHGELKGRWLLEAGFGPCAQLPSETFGTLEDAEDWVRRQLEN